MSDITFPGVRLGKKEHEVLLRIGRGERVSDIARDTCRSVKTISTHRIRALEKTGFNSNFEVIRYVLQHDLRTKAAA